MTPEEFKTEILKANPEAQFLESDGYIACLPIEMEVSEEDERFFLTYVIGFASANLYPVKTVVGTYKLMRCPPGKLPKKKRFLTPEECAGKWAVSVDSEWRSLITDINVAKNRIAFAGGNDYTPEKWHEQGGMIADTATSDPYSLEIEE